MEVKNKNEEPSLEELEELEEELEEEEKEFVWDENSSAIDCNTAYLRDIRQNGGKLLTAEEEYELGMRIAKGDEEARNILTKRNLRLVVNIAKSQRYAGCSLSFEDRIQEGNLGLIRATKTFDAKKGYKFSTYATWWIRQCITRAIFNYDLIRIPVHMKEHLKSFKYWSKIFKDDNLRDPNVDEIKAWCKENSVNYGILVDTLQKDTLSSLDCRVGDTDEDTVLGDFIPAPTSTEGEVMNNALADTLRDVMREVLTEKECEILAYRFGLNGGGAMTLESVGAIFHVTRERIRQIESKALKKLKWSRKSRYALMDFLKGEYDA